MGYVCDLSNNCLVGSEPVNEVIHNFCDMSLQEVHDPVGGAGVRHPRAGCATFGLTVRMAVCQSGKSGYLRDECPTHRRGAQRNVWEGAMNVIPREATWQRHLERVWCRHVSTDWRKCQANDQP